MADEAEPLTAPVPTSKEEADAARRALAQYDLTRLEAALAVITGTKIKGALTALQEVIDGGLPVSTSAAKNLPRLAAWVDDVTRNIEADIENVGNIANPPPPELPPQPIPLIPAPVPETEG